MYNEKQEMSPNEKKCFALAKAFVVESSKEAGLSGVRFNSSAYIEAAGGLIGQISADKYRQCMKDETPLKGR